jgi:ParE toxin of type II toxin-antitoxin system, parDE
MRRRIWRISTTILLNVIRLKAPIEFSKGWSNVRLTDMPERGNLPRELLNLGVTEYREAHYKPYRIIYRIIGWDVVVYCVVDGRRDMQSFLERRNLR